jgi:hypothetical protein
MFIPVSRGVTSELVTYVETNRFCIVPENHSGLIELAGEFCYEE